MVLHWGHSTLLSPVKGGWEVTLGEISSLMSLVMTALSVMLSVTVVPSVSTMSVVCSLSVSFESEESLVLSWSPVNHVVDAPSSIISVLLVVLVDLDEVVLEDLESELVLLLGSVRLAVLGEMSVELGASGLVDLEEGGRSTALVVGDTSDGTGESNSCSSLFHLNV